jgi:hypothetical protein
VVEVPHALRPRRINYATLSIARIVLLVLGQTGDRALRHVEAAIKLALDLS